MIILSFLPRKCKCKKKKKKNDCFSHDHFIIYKNFMKYFAIKSKYFIQQKESEVLFLMTVSCRKDKKGSRKMNFCCFSSFNKTHICKIYLIQDAKFN